MKVELNRRTIAVTAVVTAFLLGAAAIAWIWMSAPPPKLEITVPRNVSIGQLVVVSVHPGTYPHRLRVREILPGADREFDEEAAKTSLIRLPDPGTYVFSVSKPGQYIIEALAVFGRSILAVSEEITITGTGPSPGPPRPDPPLPPAPAKKFVLIVRETGASSPAQARMYVQLRTHPRIKDKHDLWIVDKDSLVGMPGQIGQHMAYWHTRIESLKITLPALIVAPSSGSSIVYYEGSISATTTVEQLVDLIERSGG